MAARHVGNVEEKDRDLLADRRKSDVGIVGPICWQAGVPVDTGLSSSAAEFHLAKVEARVRFPPETRL